MNKIMKKIYLSVLTLGLTVVALGTTTFAWFTLSNVATVQQFEVNVTADEGIEISLDGVNWFSTITKEMIDAYILENYPTGLALIDITSEDGDEFVDLNGNPVSNGFLEFPLFFRSNTANKIVWKQPGSALATEEDVIWVANASFSHPFVSGGIVAGEFYSFDAANAARISMSPYNFQLTGSDLNTASPTITGADILARTLEDITVYQLPEAISGSNPADNRATGTTPEYSGAHEWYDNVTNDTTLFDIHASVTLPETIFDADLADGVEVLELNDDSFELIGFEYAGLVLVRVWIEGWDIDTINAILSETLLVNLRFEGVPAP